MITVEPPLNAKPLLVDLRTAAQLGLCDDIILDFSASFPSGGRAWKSVNITALALSDSSIDILHLNAYLAEQVASSDASRSSRLVLQNGTLPVDVPVSWRVELCNYLGVCNYAISRPVRVFSQLVPMVNILGSSVRTIKRSDSVRLVAINYVTDCDGVMVNSKLVPIWRIWDSSGVLLPSSLRFTVADPNIFRISANKLKANQTYFVSVEVVDAFTMKFSWANVTIKVAPGNVIAVMDSPSMISLRLNDSYILDASNSYDEEEDGIFLDYVWSCNQIAPLIAINKCGLTFSPTISPGMTSIKPNIFMLRDFGVQYIYNATLRVSGARNRTSFAHVIFSVLPVDAPKLNVISLNQLKPNANDAIRLMGSVEANYPGTASWTVLYEESRKDLINLVDLVETPLSVPFDEASVVGGLYYNPNFVLKSNILVPGASYVFQLSYSAFNERSTFSASIVIAINGPPAVGRLKSEPMSGIMLQDIFELSASLWTDEDIPLQYEFAYSTTDESVLQGFFYPPLTPIPSVLKTTYSQYYIIRAKLEQSYYSTILPQGLPQYQYGLSIRIKVFDALNANGHNLVVVQSLPRPISIETLEETFNDVFRMNAASRNDSSLTVNNDLSRSAVAFVGSTLNVVDCMGALSCRSLNRNPCTVVANTCGSCLDGYFGDGVFANTMCFPFTIGQSRRLAESATELDVGESCLYDEDCGNGWLACVEDTCQKMPKQCANNCSSNGVCRARSVSQINKEVDECFTGDPTCEVYCVCSGGSYGGTCAYTEKDLIKRQTLRSKLLSDIVLGIFKKDDVQDVSTLESWVDSIAVICEQQDELADSTLGSVTLLLEYILEMTLKYNVTQKSLLDRISEVVPALVRLSSSNSTAHTTNGLSNLEKILSILNIAVESGMLYGQSADRLASPTFTVVRSVLDSSSSRMALNLLNTTWNASMSGMTSVLPGLTTTLTGLESAMQIRPHFVSIPISTDNLAKSDSSFGMSVTRFQPRLYNQSELKSDVLRVEFDALACGSTINASSKCLILVTLQNSERANFTALHEESFASQHRGLLQNSSAEFIKSSDDGEIIVECLKNQIKTVVGICPEGEEVVVECNGTISSTYRAICPRSRIEPLCSLVTSGNSKSASSNMQERQECQLISYTADNTTCLCDFSPTAAISKVTSYITGTKGVVDLSTMFRSVSSDFVSTWTSAESLSIDDITKGWQVLVTVSTTFCIAVAAAFLGMYMDAKSMHRIAAVSNDISALKGKSVHNEGPMTSLSRGKSEVISPLQMIEASLPNIFKEDPFLTKFIREVKVYHKWFGVIFFYSENFPRPARVLSLVMSALMMLFANALTYNIANPNDGTCEAYITEADCIAQRSDVTTGSKCFWDGLSCHYNEASSSLNQVVFVAVISAVVSTPLAVFAEYVVMNHLAAKAEASKDRDTRNKREKLANRLASVALPVHSVQPSRDHDVVVMAGREIYINEMLGHSIAVDMHKLSAEIQAFRLKLATADMKTFDGMIYIYFMFHVIVLCVGFVLFYVCRDVGS
jgi:hypothetical protein